MGSVKRGLPVSQHLPGVGLAGRVPVPAVTAVAFVDSTTGDDGLLLLGRGELGPTDDDKPDCKKKIIIIIIVLIN